MKLTWTPITQNLDKILDILTVDTLGFDLTNTTAPEEGQVNWNSDDGTLQIGMPGGDVNLQIGQEMLLPRGKAIGSDIANGQLVYISGASGSKPELSLAKADAETTAAGTIAMATEDILENQNGFFTSFGIVRDVDTSAFAAGDQLFLSSTTAGSSTNVRPLQPNSVVCIGYVLYSHATEGIIFVNIDVQNPQFQEDGTLAAIGDATCWDDLKAPFTSTRRGSLSKPDFDYTNLGLLFPQNNATEIAYIIMQLPHARKADSNLFPHIHWIQSQAANAVWKMEYRLYNNGDAPGAFTTLTANVHEYTYVSGDLLQISEFPTISGTGIGISAIMDVKIYRDDNLISGDVLGKEFDVHYEIDMLGSRHEYEK